MAGAGGMREQDRNLAGIPIADRLRVMVEHPATREGASQAREVGLEVIGDEHRHTSGFLDDALQRLELGIVNLLPVASVVDIHRAVDEFEASHGASRRVHRFDGVLADLHEHVAFHVAIELPSVAGQIDIHGTHDRFLHIEPVGGIE